MLTQLLYYHMLEKCVLHSLLRVIYVLYILYVYCVYYCVHLRTYVALKVVNEQFHADVEIARAAIPTSMWKRMDAELSGNTHVTGQNHVRSVPCCV